MYLLFAGLGYMYVLFADLVYAGVADQGGPGGPGPPLELGIYRVKFLKIHKISFFLLLGPPLGKNRSSTPAHNNETTEF